MKNSLALTAALSPMAARVGHDLTPLATAEHRWERAYRALMARDFDAFDKITGFQGGA